MGWTTEKAQLEAQLTAQNGSQPANRILNRAQTGPMRFQRWSGSPIQRLHRWSNRFNPGFDRFKSELTARVGLRAETG